MSILSPAAPIERINQQHRSFLLVAPITEVPGLCRYGFGPAGWVAWVLAGAPARLRAVAARARGGGEDKGRRFALAGTDQSPLSQASRARGSIAAKDMA